MKIFILSFLFMLSAYAQTPVLESNSCPPCPNCPVCPVYKEPRSSATNRDDSFGSLMGGFQFLNTWVPSKLTGSYTQIFNRSFSAELEYATSQRNISIAGVDVGLLKESRYTFLFKYYIGNTFHVSLGPYVSDLSFDLDNKITDVFGRRLNDKAEISSVGVAFGIGNRWQFNNGITVGLDWLRISQPTGVYKVKDRIFKGLDDDKKDDVKRTGKLFRTFPAFTFFGVNLGYTF
jgi:hypothetical protein